MERYCTCKEFYYAKLLELAGEVTGEAYSSSMKALEDIIIYGTENQRINAFTLYDEYLRQIGARLSLECFDRIMEDK